MYLHMVELVLGPSLALGLLLGIYEAVVIHRDVLIFKHRFAHTVHAFLLSVFFVFCTMNMTNLFKLVPSLSQIPYVGTVLGFQIMIGIIAAMKIHAVARF